MSEVNRVYSVSLHMNVDHFMWGKHHGGSLRMREQSWKARKLPSMQQSRPTHSLVRIYNNNNSKNKQIN